MIPICPKGVKIGQMVQILQLCQFVDSYVQRGKFQVVFQTFNFDDLILLQVELLKIDQSFQTWYFLDEICLQRYQIQISELFEAFNHGELILGCVKFDQTRKFVNIFDLANLVITHVEHGQVDQSV